jgi:fibronectin type III domain protein
MSIPRHWRAARLSPRILTLVATPISTTQINLSWTTFSGNVGLAGFRIYVNGVALTPAQLNPNVSGIPVTGLSPATSYSFAVAPLDANGNEYSATPIVIQSTPVPATGTGATATVGAPTASAGGQGSTAGAGSLVAVTAPFGSATAIGGGGTGAELADWQKRSGQNNSTYARGIVFGHNFDTAAEVDQFRWQSGIGNVPNVAQSDGNVTWQADGFGGGGCLQINIPTGGTTASNWWRPLTALPATQNGKTVGDNAALGTTPVRSWNSSFGFDQPWNFRNGYYGHPAAQAANPNWFNSSTGQNQTAVWDGFEFWIGGKMKISGSRWAAGNPYGKLMYIDVMGETGRQEILIRSATRTLGGYGQTFFQTAPWLMYTSQDQLPNSILTEAQGDSSHGVIEPGSPYAATCVYGLDTSTAGKCWEWPQDEWVDFLIQVIPGQNNTGQALNPLASWPNADFGLVVRVQRQTDPDWVVLFEKYNLKWYYETSNHPPGAFNSLNPSGYMNGINAVLGWTHRYTQLFLSKEWVPPARVTAPAWWTSLADGAVTTIAGGVGQRISDVFPSPTPSTPLGGEGIHGITDSWDGAAVDWKRGELLLIANGGHADYPGNEGYALALRAATPGWRRISDPTPNSYLATYSSVNSVQTYGDGRPRSDHTSGWPTYLDGQVWFPAQSATPAIGSAAPAAYSYNRDRLGAALTPMPHSDNGGTINPFEIWGQIPGMAGTGSNGAFTFGCACADPYEHYVYAFSGFGYDRTTFYYWRIKTLGPNKGQMQSWLANGGNPYANAHWCICAPELRIAVIGDDSANQRIIVLDLTKVGQAGDLTPITNITGTGYFQGGLGVGHGAAYIARNNTIALGDPPNLGKTIYRLKIPTKTVNGRKVYDPAGQWIWSNFTPAGVTPQFAALERTFTKWNYVPDMGDGRDAIVYIGDTSTPTWVYKIPAAGI